MCALLCTVQMAESIEYDFVEQPTQDHFCVVTLELLRDPHQTACCGHHLSQEAASRLQRDGKPCPMCQRPNLSTHADLYFRRKVNEINVRCPQKNQGCKWVGEVGGLDRHLGSQCLWVRVSCPKSCGGSVLRGNLPLHLDADCPKRNYRCKYCQFQATYEVVQKQHIPQCPKQPVRCPNHCEIRTMERSNLEKHLSECPLQLVECEFSQAGCKEKVPRRDLVSHVRENAQQHLLSMSLLNLTLTRELREKMEEKDRQIAQLHQQLKKVEQLQHQGQEETRHQLNHLQDCLAAGPGLSCHNLILFEFSRKKAGNVDWYSNPFYSQGYKFSLNIVSNGDGSAAKGTHVSAYLQSLEGESDDTLHWPFVCDAQLQLLNQQGGHDHHVVTFHKELEKDSRGTIYSISTKFIAHCDLSLKYLKDDCLHFTLYITATPI